MTESFVCAFIFMLVLVLVCEEKNPSEARIFRRTGVIRDGDHPLFPISRYLYLSSDP